MKTDTETKTLALSWLNINKKEITWTVGLTLLSVIAPALLAHTPNNQWATGSIVNATLFLAAWKLGLANALFVAILPSSVALLRGMLPAPMVLLIPYIIASNILLIASASWLKDRGLISFLLPSIAKFGFLLVVTILFSAKLNSTLLIMFQWPQLITALAGGFIAYGMRRKFIQA